MGRLRRISKPSVYDHTKKATKVSACEEHISALKVTKKGEKGVLFFEIFTH